MRHPSVKVIFVRHGQTDQNVQMIAGKTVVEGDDPLNETGLQQARAVRNQLKDRQFDYIVTSPLQRAVRTAQIINEFHHVPIIRDSEIRERSVGGVPPEEWHNLFDMDINLTPANADAGGEDVQTFFMRVYRVIDRLVDTYTGKSILVVSHGGVNQAFYAYASQLSWKGNMRLSLMDNCEVREYKIIKQPEYVAKVMKGAKI